MAGHTALITLKVVALKRGCQEIINWLCNVVINEIMFLTNVQNNGMDDTEKRGSFLRLLRGRFQVDNTSVDFLIKWKEMK